MVFANKVVMRIIFIVVFMMTLSSASNTLARDKGAFDIGATSASSISDKVQWHGYYDFEYFNAESKNDTFDIHKITVWMGVPINDKVFVSSEVEYEHFTRLESGTGEATGGGGELKLDNAMLRVTPVEGSVGYLGAFYVPFGIEYFSYPGFKNKLVSRPKVMKSGGIIPGTWSDVGLGFNQTFNNIGQVDFFAINGDANNGGISRDTSTGGNQNKSVGGRVQLDSLFEGVNVGASYVLGKWDNDNDSYRVGAHLRVDTDKIIGNAMAPTFIGEYVVGEDENDSSVAGMDKDVSGFYVQASSSVHQMVDIVARYGEYDNDEDKADNNKKETSVGFVLHLLDNFQIKGEYQWNEEQGANKTDNDQLAIQVNANW